MHKLLRRVLCYHAKLGREASFSGSSLAEGLSQGIAPKAQAESSWYKLGKLLPLAGSEKGVFWKMGVFSEKSHFLEILENLETLEILANPQTVENKGESDHFLEILENLEFLEILEISPVKRPLS